MAKKKRGILAPLVILVVLLAIVVALGAVVWHLLTGTKVVFIPPSQQCIATVGTTTASFDLEQSHYASIIVAESIRRGLEPRAASIALATALQESNLRNLDYGDRDSVGLFQQRPSQGWGTEAELMNPWYASGKFYAALVKVSDWKTGDLNDVAQEVQKSGVPDGYRKHVDAARALASAATGYSPAALSCVNRATTTGNAKDLAALLTKTFAAAKVTTSGATVTVSGLSTTNQWAAASLAMLNTGTDGVSSVTVDSKTWSNDGQKVATWTTAAPSTSVVITVRS